MTGPDQVDQLRHRHLRCRSRDVAQHRILDVRGSSSFPAAQHVLREETENPAVTSDDQMMDSLDPQPSRRRFQRCVGGDYLDRRSHEALESHTRLRFVNGKTDASAVYPT